MPTREPRAKILKWRAFNVAYGPWYRLVRHDGKPLNGWEVVVQPDMDRSRWFWYVRKGRRETPAKILSGHEPSLEQAREMARITFDELHH